MEIIWTDIGGQLLDTASNYVIENLSFLSMKLRVFLIAIILLAPLTPTFSASPPKAGAHCSKAGLTKSYKGKKYTCIKSGKKLLWNKGVVIKVATASRTPTPTASTKSGTTVGN